MSIPLVQKAEKDDINTSIIAIKRNIERINMLLGLVDSGGSDPDLSGLATKQELQDAVESLQPVDEVAVDNMHSVSSNAVAESLSYSTTEHKTGGKWIDGKPIYRKTWYSATNWSGDVTLGYIENLGTVTRVINISAYLMNGSIPVYYENYGQEGSIYSMAYVRSDNGAVVAQRSGGFNNNAPSSVTVEYTKTTD